MVSGSEDPMSLSVTLIDFGLASSIGEEPTHAEGTRLYLPPEAFEETYKVESKHDIWSAGLVLYVMLTGELPADSDLAGPVPTIDKRRTDISAAAQDLMSLLLEPDPSRRLSAQAALQHEWLQGCRANVQS